MTCRPAAFFNNGRSGLSRRRVIAGLLVSTAAARPVPARSQLAVPDVYINAPAIPAAQPSSAFLIAITRAGARLVAVGAHGLIIYSDDDGATWRQSAVPVNATMTCVAFANPKTGWAAGHAGIVLQTSDGGESWHLQLDGVQVDQLILAAAQNVDPKSDMPAPLALARNRAAIFGRAGPNKPFLTILASSVRQVFVFGAYRMAVMTNDGGATWADISLHIDDAHSHDLYDVLRVGRNIYLVGEAGLIFRSTDGGNTFPQLTPVPPVTLFGIVAALDGSLISFGVAGSAVRSTDGGKSWTPIDLGTSADLTAGHVLTSGRILIATETGVVYSSTDDGIHFATLSALPSKSIFDFVQAPSGAVCFAGGGGTFSSFPAMLNL